MWTTYHSPVSQSLLSAGYLGHPGHIILIHCTLRCANLETLDFGLPIPIVATWLLLFCVEGGRVDSSGYVGGNGNIVWRRSNVNIYSDFINYLQLMMMEAGNIQTVIRSQADTCHVPRFDKDTRWRGCGQLWLIVKLLNICTLNLHLNVATQEPEDIYSEI